MSSGSLWRRVPRWAWVVAGLALIGLPMLALALGALALFGLWQWGGVAIGEGQARLNAELPAWVAKVDEQRRGLEQVLARVGGEATAPLAEASRQIEKGPEALAQGLGTVAAGAAAAAVADAQAWAERLPAGADALATRTADAASGLAGSLAQPVQQGAATLAAATAALSALALPTQDVGGTDPEDLPRLPGFVRVAWKDSAAGPTVAYAGPAPMREVVEFYREELDEDGWQVRVLEADAESERLLVEREGRRFELLVGADGPRRSRLQWQPLAWQDVEAPG
ncbi:MAG: hypothetical protein MEQ07_09535 [Aquimonas sp.]|nr:hypothetical protein [Aquimonas sp.]